MIYRSQFQTKHGRVLFIWKKIHWIGSNNFRAFHHHLKNQRTNLDLASNFGASKKQFNKSEGKND